MRTSIVVAASFALVVACHSGESSNDSEETPFAFTTLEQVFLDVQVLQDGRPVQGATVSLEEAYDTEASTEDSALDALGTAVFHGGTGSDGHCRAVVPVPLRHLELDLVVHRPGLRGPYSNERLRAKWGPFAPSSRQRVTRRDLASLTIELED